MVDIQGIWNSFLSKIKDSISPMLYETWFAETEIISLEDNTAKIKVPMHVHKKHLKEHYYELISDVFSEVSGSNFKIEFYTPEEIEQKIEIEVIGVPSNTHTTNLNLKYTFENFIVGESNKFAKTSALAVAEKPGLMYNPLFIYGNSGLGKTHLMHAIGNYITNNSSKKVLYVTSEQFVNDFIELYRKNKDTNNFENIENFKRKYRDIDVLMIDDIQYLEIALKTQQEFFNTFNELHSNNKQIVISSDRSVDDLKQLEERLRTRFNWGLNIDIKPPNFQLRLDIIDKKIEGNNLFTNFPNDVKEFIANNCTSDIRKLEGAITRVFAYATMMNENEITLDLAVNALRDYFSTSVQAKNKVEQIQQLVANNYNITVEDMKSKKKTNNIAIPRQIAMYICRVLLKESYQKIGFEFGGKNHSTVMHSVEKIENEMKNNEMLKEEIHKLINKLK